jgi:tRNA 2-thiouridine synthesizing protein A
LSSDVWGANAAGYPSRAEGKVLMTTDGRLQNGPETTAGQTVMTTSTTDEPEDTGADVQKHPPAATTWDAGDMGCGELVMLLRLRLNALPPGSVLRLVARDPGAPEDLPAWCRLTGHRLVRAAHPVYDIQRKET